MMIGRHISYNAYGLLTHASAKESCFRSSVQQGKERGDESSSRLRQKDQQDEQHFRISSDCRSLFRCEIPQSPKYVV
jgi:hypothetical protein